MGIKYQNNASTTIPGATAIGATSVVVDTGTGSEFAILGAGDYFYATIHNPTNPAIYEIVKVTALTDDTLTVVRGQEGTAARDWPADTHIEQRITAATIRDGLNERLSKSGDTLTGDLDFAGNRAVQPRLQAYRETVATVTPAAGTGTCDLSAANVFDITLAASSTALAFSNPPASGLAFSFTVIVRQDATGNRALTYPASVKFPNGSSPTLATGAGKVDVLTFFTVDGGTTYFGGLHLANL